MPYGNIPVTASFMESESIDLPAQREIVEMIQKVTVTMFSVIFLIGGKRGISLYLGFLTWRLIDKCLFLLCFCTSL